MTTLSTYQRLGVHVMASNREVIRAAKGKIRRDIRRAPAWRDERKRFYRLMLKFHAQERALYLKVMKGDFR